MVNEKFNTNVEYQVIMNDKALVKEYSEDKELQKGEDANIGYNLQNKKTQNGDKPTGQFVNPKHTCLVDTFHRSPIRSDCRKVEVPPSGSQGVQFVDSTIEDDSRMMQMGALKRGHQSPDPTNNKMGLRRKIKRVLESDDSDSEEWNVGYRARPLVSLSSDGEESMPGRRSKDKPSVVSKESANHLFSPRDSQKSGEGYGRDQQARSFFVAAGMNLPDTLRSSRGRPLGRARTLDEKPSLAALHPDTYDAEDSTEVEFFTANSCSDNESNTELLRSFNIFRPTSGTEVHPNLSINVGSSEDEISIVYTSGPHTRSPHSKTGRRYNRGSRRSSLPLSPDVSLPDPLEQVRQVEEDERFARVLQAQFDAEVVEPPLVPRPHSPTNPCLMNIYEATSSHEDTSSVDVEEMFNPPPFLDRRSRDPQQIDLGLNQAAPTNGSTRGGTRRTRGGTRRTRGGTRRTRGGTRRTRGRRIRPIDFAWLRNMLVSEDDPFEAFLDHFHMNGDVTRGLQKSQVNRLPTRKYKTLNGASSSSELPHKKADLKKECQVCLNDYVDGDVLRLLPCFHEFHTTCIDPWLKMNRTCPVCRVVVDLDE